MHRYAKVHRAICVYCNGGLGFHDAVDSQAGKWLGPFEVYDEAVTASKYKAESCGHCSPIGD